MNLRTYNIILLFTLAIGLSAQAHAGFCGNFLLRVGNLALAFSGRSLMQEKLPIKDQLLAKDFTVERDLAAAWLEREDREYFRRHRIPGVVQDYWGPSLLSIDFIQTVPQWQDLKNEDLRPLVLINNILSNWDLLKEENVAEVFAEDLKNVRQTDFARWLALFPDRPLLFHR